MFRRIEKIATAVDSYSGVVKAVEKEHLHPKLFFSQPTYKKIFDRLKLKKQYPNASNELSVIDFHASFAPSTYLLNKELKPKHYALFPANLAASRFWAEMKKKDPRCRNMVIDLDQTSRVLKHNFLNNVLANKDIEPKEQTDLSKLNQSVLLVGNFIDSTGPDSLRILLFFNQVKTSVFQYNNVKFLAWMPSADALKFIGPLGSRHRRANALMANLFTNVDVIAYSNEGKKKSVSIIMDKYKDAVKLPRIPGQKDSCLMEFQSNYSKYNIRFPEELHLIIHKLLISPSNKIIDNLHTLGPGAKEYLEPMLDPKMLQKTAPNITEQEFIDISEAYYYWPFKPNTQLETFLGDAEPDEE